ncbi:MAG: hypothetical protein Q8L01_02490, partial [Candidatus Woesebacteria bacterium]|nr:hypothetical protein [Candidatus Woesebacteria bacterium]
MENETQIENQEVVKNSQKINPIMILVVGMIIGAVLYGILIPNSSGFLSKNTPLNIPGGSHSASSVIDEKVLPKNGAEIPVVWGDLGIQLVNAGAIDEEKFKSLYESRSQFTDEYKNLLTGNNNGKIRITKDNAGYYLNLFWALGLANKNPVLDAGEMVDPKYGGAGNFASTGGWTMAKGKPMDHYSKHAFITLTPAQQALVDK